MKPKLENSYVVFVVPISTEKEAIDLLHRTGFGVARGMAPLVRIGMRASATQLWADDLVYAARLYELRRSAAER